MKFRAKLYDSEAIKQFTHLISVISRLSKTCCLRITKDVMYFILSERGNLFSSPSLWCELEPEHFFPEYAMAGVAPENDEIHLSFKPDMLVKVLGTLRPTLGARSIKIRLTRKQVPCLTFEIDVSPVEMTSRICTHDVPVTIVSRKCWDEYKKPIVPLFDLSITMPDLTKARRVVEKMRKISPRLTIFANQDGKFVMTLDEDDVKLNVHFRDLRTFIADQSQGSGDVVKATEVTIESKKLEQFFASDAMNPAKVVCNIVEKRLLHLLLIHDGINLEYYLPALAS